MFSIESKINYWQSIICWKSYWNRLEKQLVWYNSIVARYNDILYVYKRYKYEMITGPVESLKRVYLNHYRIISSNIEPSW